MQVASNDCAIALFKTIYYYIYKKEIKKNKIPKITNVNGLSIEELEKLCAKNKIHLETSKYILNDFKIIKLSTPFAIILKNFDIFHYYMVIYKGKKGITLDNFNGESKFYTYEDIQNKFTGICINFKKRNRINKNLLINGIFEKINVFNLYFTELKIISLSILLLILYLASSISLSFYFIVLFKELSINYQSFIIIIIFFILTIFNFLFNFGYRWIKSFLFIKIKNKLKKVSFFMFITKKYLKEKKPQI